MKKLFILAIAALGMFACTEHNTPETPSLEEGVIAGKKGDIVGCWVTEGNFSGYYEFASDGYMTRYENNIENLYTLTLWYTDEQYLPENYYDKLYWLKDYEAPYQYDKERLTVYAGWTPTYSVYWIDGSHVVIDDIGACKRIDPRKYFSNLKTVEKDYDKDWQAVMNGHEKHFCVGKDKAHNLKWIEFAHGNLQYQKNSDTWRFAEHQYDMTITKPYGNRWADIFSANNLDQNEKITSIFAPEWRFLTYEEFNYISGYFAYHRPNYKALMYASTVAGAFGAILLPDAWATPSGMAWPSGIPEYSDQYSAEQWTIMESQGAVFLPRTYFEDYYVSYMLYVSDIGKFGAFSVCEDGICSGYQSYSYCFVRLVRDVK